MAWVWLSVICCYSLFDERTDHINISAANIPEDHITRENHNLAMSENGGLASSAVSVVDNISVAIATAPCESVVIIINSHRAAAINTEQITTNCNLVSFWPAIYATAMELPPIIKG